MLQEAQMKRLIILFLASFLFGIFIPVASFAESSKSITILYTGAIEGSIEPVSS